MTSLRLVIIILVLGLGFGLSAFAFEEPVDLPPEGLTSGPVLTGPIDEVRYGPLAVEGGVTAEGPFISRSEIVTSDDLTVTNNAEFCLNGVCITEWTDMQAGFVRLSPGDADNGFIHLTGQATFEGAPDADFGLYSRAIAPSAAPTYGFSGSAWTSVDSDNRSYGLLGIAAHNNPVVGRIAHGVFGGDGGNPNAYAGYFTGRVDIVDNSMLCLIDPDDSNTIDCRNTWPIAGPADDPLELQSQWPTDEQSGWTAVSGAARFTTAVLGDPAGHSPTLTCGDGVCTEVPADCPVDCPAITNIQAAWQSPTAALVTWASNTPMTSVVEYGLTDEYGSRFEDPTAVLGHSVLVEGLDDQLSYHYRVGGTTEGSGAALFSADQILPDNYDDLAPDSPTNLNHAIHLPPPDPEKVRLTWSHPLTDNPPGSNSGFSEFRIYREISGAPGDPVQIGTATGVVYEDVDPALNQAVTYDYTVRAVDNNDNQSAPASAAVHIPKRCLVNPDCSVDVGYPNCCNWSEGGKACAVSCGGGGSSPIMAKFPYTKG